MTVGYNKVSGDVYDPDPRQWKYNVVHVWMSYGSNRDLITIRDMIKDRYPDDVYLKDLLHVHVDVNNDSHGPASDKADKSTQMTTRIYMFPVPLPQLLAAESVTWREPIVKEALNNKGNLWHARLGHCGDDFMSKMSWYLFFDIPRKQRTNSHTQPKLCECCAKCKFKIKCTIPASVHKTTLYLECVDMKRVDFFKGKTYCGNIYFTVFVDEYTRYKWVCLQRSRCAQALEIFEQFVLDATTSTDNKIAILRTDKASEFLFKDC